MNYLKVTDVAKKLGVSRQTVFDWMYKLNMPYYRWGSQGIRILETDLDEWLKQYRNARNKRHKTSKLINI
jgi:excisionase family DNA binding protein